jgi:cephalosporin hydroxylase
MKLIELFENHDGRECGKWSHYFDIYERYLQSYVGKEVFILELGVCQGGSLQLWKKYFGDKAKVVGVDIDPRAKYEEDQIEVEIGDLRDPKFLMYLIDKHGAPDIIIDDASHETQQVLWAMGFFMTKLKEDGVYIIEDVHTHYRPEYNGGCKNPYNIINALSQMTHDVNVNHIEEPFNTGLGDIRSISYYDSLVIIEKGNTNTEPVFSGEQQYNDKVSPDEEAIQMQTRRR